MRIIAKIRIEVIKMAVGCLFVYKKGAAIYYN
jgi:hypothetical protein